MHIWNGILYKYQICVHRCSRVHACKLRSVFSFQKFSTGIWAPDWTFAISAMQGSISEVFFSRPLFPKQVQWWHKCLFAQAHFFLGNNLMDAMSTLPTWITGTEKVWNGILFLEQMSVFQSPLKDSEKTTHKLQFYPGYNDNFQFTPSCILVLLDLFLVTSALQIDMILWIESRLAYSLTGGRKNGSMTCTCLTGLVIR